MIAFFVGVVVGVLWAYAPAAGYFVIVWWLKRRARRSEVDRLLARAAIHEVERADGMQPEGLG